jgi:DEAD/DEAH box helicase domain-containing protein
MLSLEQFVAQLVAAPPAGSQVRAHLTLTPALAPAVELPDAFPPWLATMLQAQGIEHLAEYQWHALQLWQQGQHLGLSVPTGGGRGVVRLLALYHSLGTAQGGHALCIFPQKDRELAQLARITAWNAQLPEEHRLPAAIYDGDTPQSERRLIKQSLPHLLLTTPEMLHAGILAYHAGWRAFFQDLRVVVLADAHLCGGALGAHLAHLLQRLQRISVHYGSQPQYLITSSPIANFQDMVQTLTGQSSAIVSGELFCRYTQSRILLEVQGDAEPVLQDLVERLHATDAPPLVLTSQGMGNQQPISPHSALRTPHAVRSLVCLGIPSSLTRLHEYLSLLASSQAYSVSVLLLRDETPLERYLLHYPDVYQTLWLQDASLYPSNSQVAQRHLLCAAAELALAPGERYASMHGLEQLLPQLSAAHAIERRSPSGAWVTTRRQPHRQVRLRVYEPAFAVVQQHNGQFLAQLSSAQAFRDCFVGAVYSHSGQTFHVERVIPEMRRILVRPTHTTSLTRGLLRSSITEQRVEASVSKETYRIASGALVYTETLHAFERLDAHTHARTSVHALPETQHQVQTQGVWIDFATAVAMPVQPVRAAVHTLVHAILRGLPLLLVENATSLSGGVYNDQVGTGLQAVFVDAPAGGNGVSAFLYRAHERVLRLGLQMLLHCDCDQGCPRCIAVPTCATCTHDTALQRQAGIALLQRLLEEVVPPLEKVRPARAGETTASGPRSRGAARHIYLSLTTQKSAEDVGGWQHKHLLGLGVAVTYDTQDRRYRVYTTETVAALLASLWQANLVIGFNLRDFDYQVLQPYATAPLATLPTLALLDEVQQGLGFRLSLSHLVHATLGLDRPDDSLHTLDWFRQGERDRVAAHCRRNVELLQALVHHGATTGSIVYCERSGERRALPVHWQFAEYDG